MAPLFLTPFVFVFALAATYFANNTDEGHKWSLYYMCLLVPVIAYFLFRKPNPRFFKWQITENFTVKAMGAFLFLSILGLPGSPGLLSLLFGAVACLAFWVYLKKSRYVELQSKQILFFLLLSCLSWKLCSRLTEWWSPDHLENLVKNNSLLLAVTLVIVVLALFENIFRAEKKRWQILNHILTFASIPFFLYLCGRPYELDDAFMHHHSFYAGPIEMVRQGGLLLWDVPSQYGLLNIYLASKLNWGSSWQTLLILNKIFVFAGCVLLYFFLRQFFRSVWGNILSVLVAAMCTFCWTGYIQSFMGPLELPSVGAFRFIWCGLLLFSCYLLTINVERVENYSRGHYFVLGNLIWVVSFFWSAEIAIYTTLIWLSFHFMAWFSVNQNPPLFPHIRKVFAKSLLLLRYPLLAMVLITACYALTTPRFPDWKNYYDYLIAYKAGYNALPVDPNGAVWTILCLFALGTVVALLGLYQKSKYAPFMVAGLAFFWSVASYYNSRSHENNIATLMPLIVFFVVSILLTAKNLQTSRLFNVSLLLIFIPFFTFIVESPATHPQFSEMFPKWTELDYLGQHLAEKPTDSTDYVKEVREIADLKSRWGISPTEPSVFLYAILHSLPTDSSQPEYWLPMDPAMHFEIMPTRRQPVYFDRFVERKKIGGWLFQLTTDTDDYKPIYAMLEAHFRLVETKTEGRWIAKKYEYKQSN